MTLEEAKMTIYANCIYACEKAGFDLSTICMVDDALRTVIAIADRKTESNSEKPNNCEDWQDWKDKMWAEAVVTEPQTEPNLILPGRMERGEVYEIGETIVVMNHEDYYDMLCKSMEAETKHGEWIYVEHDVAMCDGYRCDRCGFFVPWDYEHKSIDFINDYHFCPNCGARMKGADDEY